MRHPTTIHRIAALCLLGFLIAGSGSAAAAEGIRWYSYEEGAASSRSSGKKLFLHFYADWCGFCEKMEKETLIRGTKAA
jgi:thiol-disulfide isomerase/thioredoxin